MMPQASHIERVVHLTVNRLGPVLHIFRKGIGGRARGTEVSSSAAGAPGAGRMKSIGLAMLSGLLLLAAQGQAGERIFIDDAGRRVAVPSTPRRIVSLAPSLTENLFALGLGDKIVGVTDYCDFPPEALKKEKVGGGLNPSLERIASLRPDLIVALQGAGSTRAVTSLEKLGLPVYLFESRGFAGVLKTIEGLGRLTGTEGKAKEIVEEIKARAQALEQLIGRRRRPRVLFVAWLEPIWTVGKDSFLNDLIEKAGGASVTADIKGETTILGPEAVIQRAPEIILVSQTFGGGRQVQPLKAFSRLSSVPAIRDGKVFVLDSYLLNRSSYRVAQGVEELARIFHPELFSEHRE